MSSSRDTPDAAVTTTADAHTRLPDRVHEQTEYEVAVAYHQGYHDALRDIAGRIVELHTTWAPIGRRAYAQWVRERLEQMEAKAITAWRGLDNGAVLPSTDWADTKTTTPVAPGTHIRRAA